MSNTTQLAKPDNGADALTTKLVFGDVGSLSDGEIAQLVLMLCDRYGLDAATAPLRKMKLSGGTTLYLTKGGSQQLARNIRISFSEPRIEFERGLCITTITGSTPDGRTDTDVAAVPFADLKGEAAANAVMKCVTKVKRRLTLSMGALGLTDESEVDSIPGAQTEAVPPHRPAPALPAPTSQTVSGVAVDAATIEQDGRTFDAESGEDVTPERAGMKRLRASLRNRGAEDWTVEETRALVYGCLVLPTGRVRDLAEDQLHAAADYLKPIPPQSFAAFKSAEERKLVTDKLRWYADEDDAPGSVGPAALAALQEAMQVLGGGDEFPAEDEAAAAEPTLPGDEFAAIPDAAGADAEPKSRRRRGAPGERVGDYAQAAGL